MEIQAADPIQQRLLQVVAELSVLQQQEVLNFALLLRQKELAEQWDAISDQEAAVLKAEFDQEDREMAEMAIVNTFALLQNEDEA